MTKYKKDEFPDTERDIRSGGAVVRLGKPGTDSKLSGMAHKTVKQKNWRETYLDTSW